jgi:hypothetical protein
VKEMNDNKHKILSALEELYGSCKQNKYFLLVNRREEEVRIEILNKLIGLEILDKDNNLFDLYINDTWGSWGFDIIKINKNLKSYSFFKLTIELPNGAERRILHWNADVLFLRTPLLHTLSELEDTDLWNPNSMTRIDKFKLYILQKLFY